MSDPASSPPPDVDIAIVGGGLSGGLIALRLKHLRPDLKVALIDGAERLGGNHTWSFHETDLSLSAREWTKPLVTYAWDRQEVRFPKYRRELGTGYRSVASERFDEVLRGELGDQIMTGVPAASLSSTQVTLEDQSVLRASAVLDARGQRGFEHLALGFQKFVGLELEFAAPHGLAGPIIMDGTVPQLDGFRFMYTLPFTPTTALVEDTYYADGSALDREAIEKRITEYCAVQGWQLTRILRREDGILPIALGGDIEAHLDEGPEGVGTVGLAAGLFHPLTGYSFPDAVALAEKIAAAEDLSGPALSALTRAHAKETWEHRGFYRLLSRLLFDAAEPEKRYIVMQRFYRFGEPLIQRLYAGDTTAADKLRILAGKPPVPVTKAMKCLSEERWMAQAAKQS